MTEQDKALAQLLASLASKVTIAGYREGLQPVHWVALRYFHQCNASAATVMHFASHHKSTKGTASTTISLLVKKGLLERVPVEGDRRTHRLLVTHAGLEMLESDPLNSLAEDLMQFDRADKLTLASILGVLLRKF